jgi:hypothetical protein
LTTIPPTTALYARFVRVQSTERLFWTTIPTIRARSCRISRPRGLGPHAKPNYKDQNTTLAIGPGMTGHTATIPKDRNHSLNSGKPASPCCSSTKSTDTMPLQYKPRRHRIRPPEASELLPRQGSPTHRHVVTLYLLKAIKGACRDHSIGQDQEESITRSHNSPRACEGSNRATHTHTHSTHVLRLGSPSLSHSRL